MQNCDNRVAHSIHRFTRLKLSGRFFHFEAKFVHLYMSNQEIFRSRRSLRTRVRTSEYEREQDRKRERGKRGGGARKRFSACALRSIHTVETHIDLTHTHLFSPVGL